MSAEPQFADTSDPRVYGYDYENGLTPNFAFDGQWAGTDAVPSSDSGEVVRMSEIYQIQNQERQAQQAQAQHSQAVAAMEHQQRLYQQSLQAQPVYAPPATHNFYEPVPTRPLYPEQGAVFQPMVQPPSTAAFAGAHAHAQPRHSADLSGLMLRPQPPAVPAPHAVPPYPWKAHGQPGSFDGPEGTSPMSRGGPNVGAFAAAPGVPRDYTGAAYPMAAPGTYVPRDGMPPFAGYAGLDLSGLDQALAGYGNDESWRDRQRAKSEQRKAARAERKAEAALINYEKPERGQYRDVTGKDGQYKYRQFQDGIIRIMEGSPARQGLLLAEGDASTAKAWRAITNEIGTWDQYVSGRRDSRIKAAGSILETAGKAVSTIAGGQKKKKRRKKKGRRAAGAAAPAPMDDFTEEPEESGLPSWVLPVGIGVAVLGVIFLATQGKKEKGKG